MISLIFGDCLEKMREIQSESIDLVLCDPPYGTTACKWDAVIPLEPMWAELARITKSQAAILIFGSEPFSTRLRQSNFDNYRFDWYWDKCFAGNFVQAKRMPLKTVECISVFSNGKLPRYFPQMEKREKPIIKGGNKSSEAIPIRGPAKDIFAKGVYDLKHPTTLLRFSGREGRGHHPTQKPISLLEYLIKTYCEPGETVLDFTMGSGSTAVAAQNIGRNFIGIENDRNYFNCALDRVRGVI